MGDIKETDRDIGEELGNYQAMLPELKNRLDRNRS